MRAPSSAGATPREPTRGPTGFGDAAATKTDQLPRAEPPRAPKWPPNLAQAEAERASYRREREAVERRSMLRGLILLAVLVILFALLRAGLGRAFPTGLRGLW